MKKFFKGVGNFFKKIGLFVWKYIKIAWNYVKENAWIQPIAIVAVIFAFVFGFQGIVNGIEKIKENKTVKEEQINNKYTKITMGEAREKIDNKEDFILFIGANYCAACKELTKNVINPYVTNTGTPIYYVDTADTSDTTFEWRYYVEWTEKAHEIETRSFLDNEGNKVKTLSTPTVVIVRGGEFADAKMGYSLTGGSDYLNYAKFLEGEYIGRFEA